MTVTERKQRIHELNEAYKAARHLEERLELCVDWEPATDNRQRVRRVRQDLAAELIVLGRPMADFQ